MPVMKAGIVMVKLHIMRLEPKTYNKSPMLYNILASCALVVQLFRRS